MAVSTAPMMVAITPPMTMVKSGVYLVARFVPLFYYGHWTLGIDDAAWFFSVTAWVGAFTALRRLPRQSGTFRLPVDCSCMDRPATVATTTSAR